MSKLLRVGPKPRPGNWPALGQMVEVSDDGSTWRQRMSEGGGYFGDGWCPTFETWKYWRVLNDAAKERGG